MGKIVQNSISYSGVSARNYTDLIDVLSSGSTTLIIRSASIKEDSTINLYTDKYGVNPTQVVLSDGQIRLNFNMQSDNITVKVRIWDKYSGGGPQYDDGNNIYYPIADPSHGNKLYKESDVSAIAYALGETLKISEMADAVQTVVERTEITEYNGARALVLAECEIVQIDE